MKSIYLSICLLIVGFNVKAQFMSSFHPEFVPTSTLMNLNSGDDITFDIVIDPFNIPSHGGVFYTQVRYSVSYILVDQTTGLEFFLGNDNLYANGWEYTSIQGWTDASLTSSVTINNCVPAGNYWIKIKMNNLEWLEIEPPTGFNDPGLTVQSHYYPYGLEPPGTVTPILDPDQIAFDISAYNQVALGLDHCTGDGYTGGNPSCELTYVATISVTNTNTVFSNFNLSTTGTNCSSNTGTGTATPIDGVSPFTYLWSNGQTTQTATNLGIGDYSIQVTDFDGCTITGTVNIPSPLSVSPATVTTTLCSFNTGTANVIATSPNTPISYLWSNAQTTATATGLAEGTYSVTITDVGGCSVTENNIVINYPYDVTANLTTQQPCTFDEGAVYTLPSSGVAPYNYVWSNGQQTQNIEGVMQDAYTVTITDANGCVGTETTTLTNQVSTTYFDYPNGLIITSPSQQLVDVTGDGNIQIRGTMVIESGVNYTINNTTLEFARDLYPDSPDLGETHSGVIIEEGAKLTANNCTFKGVSACNAMWQGIQVWGEDCGKIIGHNGPKAQAFQAQHLNHGKFIADHCEIRDAFIGVALYRVNMPFIQNPKEYGRGYISATYTNFINNRISVDFRARTSVTNTSRLLECNFSCDQPLLHPFKYNGEGSDIFIRLIRVDQPQFRGNTFTGNLVFTADKRATGIRSYASSYIVQSGNAGAVNVNTPPLPNVFTNLSQGVDIYAKGGGVKTIRIKDNRFNNVYQGIIGNGSNFDEISFNTFNIPMGEPFFNAWGIYLETASGFVATENTFNTIATNNLTFGFVVKDVNLINGEIYKNTFNGDFESATQAEGLANNQLQIDCNQYLGTNTHDWTILSTDMADQGQCGIVVTDQVKNIFGNCSVNDDSQIYSNSAVFNYSSESAFLPSCINLQVNNIPCITASTFEETCPQQVSAPCPQCLPGLKNQFNNLPPSLQRKKVKGELIRELAKNGDTQGIVDVLTTDLLPEDKRILIPIHIKKEKYNEARNVLNTFTVITVEDQLFYDLLITIGETDRVLAEITVSEKQTVENVANSQTPVAIQAQSVLAELNQTSYIRFPQQIPPNSSAMVLSGEESTETQNTITTKQNITVYPNPSQGEFTINFEESKNGQGQIIDATGRVVLVIDVNNTQNNYQINDLPYGIYTLIINYNDGSVEYTRVIAK